MLNFVDPQPLRPKSPVSPASWRKTPPAARLANAGAGGHGNMDAARPTSPADRPAAV